MTGTLLQNLNDVLRYTLANDADFHRQIVGDQHAHLNHLAYADWLQEQGKEGVANFIRTVVDRMQQPGSKSGVGYMPTFRPGGDKAVVVGSWSAHGHPLHAVHLRLHNASSPEGTLLWTLHSLSPEEASSHVKALVGDGVEPAHDEAHRMAGMTPPERFSANDCPVRYMADHADFHRQLVEHPEDVLNSTVYADYLDEQGHPAKAAFIRKVMGQEHPVLSPVQVMKGSPTPFEQSWRLAPIRDGSNLHMMLILNNAGPERNHFIHWRLSNTNPEEVKSGMGPALAAEGVEVPKFLNKPVKNAVTDSPLRYSADASDFHNAIHKNPEEGTNGLVYADWLQEQGRDAHADLVRQHVADTGTGGVPHVHQLYFDPVENYERRPAGHTQASLIPQYDYTNPTTDGWHVPKGARVHLNEISPDVGRSISWETPSLDYKTATDLHKRLVGEEASDNSSFLLEPPDPVSEDTNHLPDIGDFPMHMKVDDEVVKYAAVPNHDLHEDYQSAGIAPRIGHLLNKIAGDNSDAGLLAEGIARTGDHSLLKILADKLDDDGHPLKDAIDWRHAERGIKVDRALGRALSSRTISIPAWGNLAGTLPALVPLHPSFVMGNWQNGRRSLLSRRRALDEVRKAVPDASRHDVNHSILRLLLHRHITEGAERGMDPPDWYTNVLNEQGKQLGTEQPDFHKYPDTRPPNKRLYLLEDLKAKYRAVKYSHESFQKPLHENQKDATTGGVYADWLQDQGLDTHAEFIRRATDAHQEGLVDYRRKGMVWTTHSDKWHDAPFAVAGWHDAHSGLWNLDLSSRFSDNKGNRLLWTLYDLPHQEAKRLTENLVREGAGRNKTVGEGLGVPEKYAAWKAPVGGMIVKESPLAVTGSYVEGGAFTPDLAKLGHPVEYKASAMSLKELRKRWKKVKHITTLQSSYDTSLTCPG